MWLMSEHAPSDDVAAWFAERGFRLVVSDADFSAQVRRSPRGRTAPSRDHHVWVDLLANDGRVVHGGYGSGGTPEEAFERGASALSGRAGGQASVNPPPSVGASLRAGYLLSPR